MKLNISSPETISQIKEIIKQFHGINLTGVNSNLIGRRIELLSFKNQITDINQLINLLANNNENGVKLVQQITPGVTGMFRDPGLFLRLSRIIVNQQLDKQTIRIWHAGCADGLEVYSMAIRLYETNLLSKAILYGTDINETALRKAKKATVNLAEFKNYSSNYIAAGGENNLTDYFSISYNQALLKHHLRNKLFFGKQELGMKENFQNYQLILCRNLLYYYDSSKQNEMLEELINAMVDNGIICFGIGENIEHLPASLDLSCIDEQFRIYKKRKNQ